MMASRHIHASQHSVPSPNGALIATLQPSILKISTYAGIVLQTNNVPLENVSKCRFIRWSQPTVGVQETQRGDGEEQPSRQCSRILLADDDSVHVYDVNDPKWSAKIEGACANLGKIADVAFGHTANEVLVFSDFGVKLTIWSLITSRGVEIRDPKYAVRCYTNRPTTGHLAILTRPAAQDVLMLLNPGNYRLIDSVELPTVDAQEVAWSPDGRWLAIRDAASSGHKALIYTADGHLFKTYNRGDHGGDVGLGVKTMEWSPSTGLLAIGDFNETVTILGQKTVILLRHMALKTLTSRQFSSVAEFHHPDSIVSPDVSIWQEQLDVSRQRSYAIAPQPASPPTSASVTKTGTPPRGVSIIAFSADGSLLATKDDSMLTTIWIWSLITKSAVTVLIHHSPVKHLAWHPSEPDLLFIHCAIPEPFVHFWKSSWESPRTLAIPLEKKGGRLEANWLRSGTTSQFNLLFSSSHQYTIAHLSNSGEIIPQAQAHDFNEEIAQAPKTDAEDMFDEGNSLDLSPIKITRDETMEILDGFDDGDSGTFGMGNEMVDDTFHYRRHVRAHG